MILAMGDASTPEARDHDRDAQARRDFLPVVIKWPGGKFASLQAAIDAAPDGATIEIKPGTYSLDAPLVVRGKSLVIAGAGSGRDTESAAQNGRQKVTHLMGPVPTEVVDGRRAVGLLNFVDGGGVLQNMKLSGFDACVLGHDGRSPRSLEIRDCALSDASRGCLWYAGANLTIVNSSFAGFIKHAVALVTQNGALSLFGVNLFDIAENAILIKSGGEQDHVIVDSHIFNCGGAGIIVQGTFAIIIDCELDFCTQGGIWFLGGKGLVDGCDLDGSGIAGLSAVASDVTFLQNKVANTVAAPSGLWGDGIVVMADALAQSEADVLENVVADSERASLCNFGSVATLEANTLQCGAFDLAGEPLFGFNFQFMELPGNVCGCGMPASCTFVSAGLAPPPPPSTVE
jgi:hypothetical protein